MGKRTWMRGAVALAVLGGLVAAVIVSPVGAFESGDKKKVKKISKKQATKVVNQMGPGIATSVAGPLAGRFAFARDDSEALVGSDGTVLSTTITVPTNGHLAINAGSNVHSEADDSVHCILNVNGTDLPSSHRETVFGEEDDCTTQGAVAVTAGTHTIQFNAFQVGTALTAFDQSVLWVIFVPFDAGGSLPTGPSLG